MDLATCTSWPSSWPSHHRPCPTWVTGLTEKGWLHRERSQRDRRRVEVALTPAGETLLDEMRQLAEARIAELLADLPDTDCDRLTDGLQLLGYYFSKLEPEGH